MSETKGILSSEEFYKKNFSHYEILRSKQSLYLDGVNRCILQRYERGPILDIGCGDGLRSLYFKDRLSSDVVGLDSCLDMCERSKKNGLVEVFHEDVADLSSEVAGQHTGRFGTVLCLWNVLGHIVQLEDRERAVKNISKLLCDGGLLFIDVNNRLNVSQYGVFRVLKNLASVLLRQKGGLFSLPVHDSVSHVYLSNKWELSDLLNQNGFVVEEMLYVHYQKGTLERSWTKGQILAICRKNI